MAVQSFVATYQELLRFLQSNQDQLFYIDINADPPPSGARTFTITTFPDEIASRVIRQIHRDTNPPRMTPAVKKRIDDADLSHARLSCGLNIDPRNPSGNPDPAMLRGTRWVRFPFYSPRHYWTLQQAFQFYDPIIEAYDNLGINVLLVLNHQTFGEGEGYVWEHMDAGKWATLTNGFVQVADQITLRYGNRVAAYEVWNEGDVPNNPSSVYIPAIDFAPLLQRTSAVIRRNAPRSKVIFGGLVGGTAIAKRYLLDTRQALGGILPVDGIGLHPYGLGAPDDDTVFSQYGNVQIAIDALQEAVPNMPIWLTEVGALGGNQNAQYIQQAAWYMDSLYQYLRQQPHKTPVVIWYAWSDGMAFESGTNGLVTRDGKRKTPIYETFFEMACGD